VASNGFGHEWLNQREPLRVKTCRGLC